MIGNGANIKRLRKLRVIGKEELTPNMMRLTLGGEGLAGFPNDQDGAYVKLQVPDGSTGETVVRTYTVRYYRPERGELDIDFVLHDVEGPAAAWARNCAIGDEIMVGGPGPKKIANHDAGWLLFAGDMSALPAIGANLEALPDNAKGHVFLEIIDAADKQAIDAPSGINIEWLLNPHPNEENSILLDAVTDAALLDAAPFAWIAGEFSQSLNIRSFLRDVRGMNRDNMYASSYWQIGMTEDGHRISKAAVKDT